MDRAIDTVHTVQINARVRAPLRDRINWLAALRGMTLGELISIWAKRDLERVERVIADAPADQEMEVENED